MKQVIFSLIISSFILIACTDKGNLVTGMPMPITDLSEHNMKIIPTNPTGNDEIKLVVFDDCTYNVLVGVNKDGNTIDIKKQFNSMMKWPCFMSNDTIQLGKLSEGAYRVNYKLLDTSTIVSNPIAVSFSFNLIVAQ